MQLSMFRLVSVGTAAQNKALSSRMLECTPDEILPYIDGDLTHDTHEMESSGVDGNGEKYTSKLKIGNTLECTWLSFGTNRITPPDVRRGEGVFIWQFADTDMYFWSSQGKDNHLRRLETATYVFSATKDETTKVLDSSNSYVLEVSTHRKLMTVTTSKANGEKFAYTIQINADKGGVVVMDDDGQYLELNSPERRWTIKNKDGSYYKMDKDTIEEYAKTSIKRMTKAYTLECETQTVKASKSITTETAKHTAKATAGYDMTAPLSKFNGAVTITQLTTLMGGLSAVPGGGSGTAVINIPLTVNASVATVGVLTNNGVNVGSTHQHNETGMGAGTTTPPI